MSRIMRAGFAAGIAATVLASVANAQVRRPSGAHAAYNFIPFGATQVCTQHQVFDRSLWSGPMEISALGFAANPGVAGRQYTSDIIVKLGYTEKIPGLDTGSGGLDVILANNPSGPMTEVFNAQVSQTIVGSGSEDFSFILRFDTPFCYDPAQGNLLVELFSSFVSGDADLSVSRTSGSSESSRAYNSTRFGNAASPTTATRMDFYEDTCSSSLTLRIGGSCPGPVSVNWDGATPNTQMGIVFASNTGSLVVPSGPCQGTTLGLGSSNIQLVNTVNTGSGSGSVNGNAGPGSCGGFVQLVVVDGSPCTTSNVVQLQ